MDLLVRGLDPVILGAQQAFNAALADMPHADLARPGGLAALRAGTRPPQPQPQLTPRRFDFPSGGLTRRAQVFVPDAPRGVVVRLHGGGYVAGAPEDDEAVNDEIARAASVVVVSPSYRLLPESTRVEQVSDCVAAACWAVTEFGARAGGERFVLAGTSAGAHLALVTVLRLRADHPEVFARFVGLHLDCGSYDLSGTPSVRAATDETLVLTRSWLDAFRALAAPGLDDEGLRAPDLSPLYAELDGLPPTMLLAGALDPLVDDTTFLAARLAVSGVDVDAAVWPLGAHAFSNMGAPLQPVALRHTLAWLDERFG